MPHDLFEIRIENLGVTDINVMQKESQWKIIQLSKEAEVVVARKDHAEKKDSASEQRSNLNHFIAILRSHSRNIEQQKESLIHRGMKE